MLDEDAALKSVLRTGMRFVGLLLWLAFAGIAQAADRIELRSMYVAPQDDVYMLHGQVAFELPEGARRAIEEGATFNLILEADIRRQRSFWFDAVAANIEQQYEVVYHAISGMYLVRNVSNGEQESFATLDAAMARLGKIELPLTAITEVAPEMNNEVSVRASLSVRGIPRVLRMLLFWTDDWAQTSGWHTWTLRP